MVFLCLVTRAMTLEQRIDQIDKRLEELDRKMEVLQKGPNHGILNLAKI